MKVFFHHIYEFRKGLRNLVLYTGPANEREAVEQRLRRENIACVIQAVGASKINVFFGNPICVEVARRFAGKPLNELSPEEDFMLGIMLGYDRIQQCARFSSLASRRENPESNNPRKLEEQPA